jgi:hypothetical protein
VLRAYLREAARVLKRDGAGFIHHSNLATYSALLALSSRIPAPIRIPLQKRGVLINNWGWRAASMDARRFARHCGEAGLQCIHQETVNWVNNRRYLTDCLSVFRRDRTGPVLRGATSNRRFMDQANDLSRTVEVYASCGRQADDSKDHPIENSFAGVI